MCVCAKGVARASTYSCIKIHVAAKGQPAQVQTLVLNAKKMIRVNSTRPFYITHEDG